MSTIVNNNDLVYVITNYGLRRIAEALEDSSVNLNLFKMKIGTGYNEEYYTPTEDQTELKGLIPEGEFYVVRKELLEDGKTISLNCVIPETFSGYDIREVGLYETINNRDELFAVVVQQPIVKPRSEYGYYMSIDYYMFLQASNLANIYDRIILNPEEQMVSEEDLDDLLRTMLFTQGNLSAQIGMNSEVIGYNRPTEFYSFAVENRNTFGYMAACNSFGSFSSYVGKENVFGYWIFDYPKRNEDYKVIKDIGPHGYNISTSQNVSLFNQNYEGIEPTLLFPSPTYYYLDSSIPLSFLNEYASTDLDYYNKVGNPTISNEGIASNFSSTKYLKSKAIIDCTKSFKVIFNEQRGSATKFNGFQLSRAENNDDSRPLFSVQCPNNTDVTFCVFINSALRLVEDNNFIHANYTSLNYIVSWDGLVYKLEIEDALTHEIVDTLTINSSSSLFNSSSNGVVLYGYNFNSGGAIQATDLRQTAVYNDDELLFSGADVGIADIPFTMMFTLNPLSRDNDITLLARSDYSTETNIFEVKELFPSSCLQIKLFTDSDNYMTFTTPELSVPLGCHSVLISYDNDSKEFEVYINQVHTPVTKVVTGTYTHMLESVVTLYGYAAIPKYIKYTFSVSPTEIGETTVCNSDGSPYIGSDWTIDQNQVYFNGQTADYTYSDNTSTPQLYAWSWEDYTIYTKDTLITENTILYNSDYTEYTGSDFSVELVGSLYKIVYLSSYPMSSNANKNISPVTLYAWVFSGDTSVIWANSSSGPTIMFNEDGSVHPNDSVWSLSNGVITFVPTGTVASYNSGYNTSTSNMKTTSYIIDSNGVMADIVNSGVGLIGIGLNKMDNEDMRILSLELGGQLGLNPCITLS